MRLWLELTQEEGERLFDAVKGFTIDRRNTAVVSASEDNTPSEGGVGLDQVSTADVAETISEEVLDGTVAKAAGTEAKATNTEDKPAVTLEIVRAVMTEKKRSGKDLKALFSKFGVQKLSEVAPTDYGTLLREAEAL